MIIGKRVEMKFSVSVTVGDDLRSVILTEKQWRAVQEGKPLVKRVNSLIFWNPRVFPALALTLKTERRNLFSRMLARQRIRSEGC
jgi:hypothetical protein